MLNNIIEETEEYTLPDILSFGLYCINYLIASEIEQNSYSEKLFNVLQSKLFKIENTNSMSNLLLDNIFKIQREHNSE